jgi:hypothetical protein
MLHVLTIYSHHQAFKNIKNIVNIRHWTAVTMDLLLLVSSYTFHSSRYDAVDYVESNN